MSPVSKSPDVKNKDHQADMELFWEELHPQTQEIVNRIDAEYRAEQQSIKATLSELLKDLNDLKEQHQENLMSEAQKVEYARHVAMLEKKVQTQSKEVHTRPMMYVDKMERLNDVRDPHAPIGFLNGLSAVEAYQKLLELYASVLDQDEKRKGVSMWGKQIHDTMLSCLHDAPQPSLSSGSGPKFNSWVMMVRDVDIYVRLACAMKDIFDQSEARLQKIHAEPGVQVSERFPLVKERQEMAKCCFLDAQKKSNEGWRSLHDVFPLVQRIGDAAHMYDLGLALLDGTPKEIKRASEMNMLAIYDLNRSAREFICYNLQRGEYDKTCAQIIRSEKEKRHLLKTVAKGSGSSRASTSNASTSGGSKSSVSLKSGVSSEASPTIVSNEKTSPSSHPIRKL